MSRITIEQLFELHQQDRAGTVTYEILQAFLRDPSSVLKHIDVLVAAPPPVIEPTISPSFNFKVNYKLTLATMIARGKFEWKQTITRKRFPHDNTLGEVEVEAEYLNYRRKMSYDAVIADLDARGMRPATLVELLAFGTKFPREQIRFPILGLGSVYTDPRGARFACCLKWSVGLRGLDLCYISDTGLDWQSGYCFLAVRK